MTRLLAWPVVLSAAAGLGSLYLAWFLRGVHEQPGARWFLVVVAGQAVLCFGYAAALLVPAPGVRAGLELLTFVAVLWLGAPFLAFALSYTGRSDLVASWPFRAVFLVPVATTVIAASNPATGLLWTDFATRSVGGVVGAVHVNQPLLFLLLAGNTVAVAAGVLLLFDTFLSYGPLYRREAIAVALSPVPPAVGVLLWAFELGPVPALNLTAPLFFPHVLLDTYAFAWSDMFEFHPATKRAAERSALDDLTSPVLTLDEQGRLVDLNNAARALFAPETGTGVDPVRDPVETLVGEPVSLTEDTRLSVTRGGRRREFRVRPAPLTDSGDTLVGYTLVFQDVTAEIRREQRLQVLNRVLRHNLRNDLSVVQGNVAAARGRVDGSTADLLAAAERKAGELVDTGEKARVVAEMVRDADEKTRETDVHDLCVRAVSTAGPEAPDQDVSVTGVTGSEATVHTSPTLLAAVVENLLENAFEYGDGTVTVDVDRSGADRITVTVTDDGPGVPEEELAPVRTGEETPLEHGSGFGLWMVRWGVDLLGGEVQFDTDDGTRVTLDVPDRTARDGTDTAPGAGPEASTTATRSGGDDGPHG